MVTYRFPFSNLRQGTGDGGNGCRCGNAWGSVSWVRSDSSRTPLHKVWCFMITPQTISEYVRHVLTDAQVTVTDRTGTMDHLNVRIVSDVFKGKNLLDRHRLIYQALDEPLKDGRIHALELTTETTDGS